jgi:hypothetical protein
MNTKKILGLAFLVLALYIIMSWCSCTTPRREMGFYAKYHVDADEPVGIAGTKEQPDTVVAWVECKGHKYRLHIAYKK